MVGWSQRLGIQHDWTSLTEPMLLRFRGAENCEVTECRFTNSGGSAIRLDLHAQNININNSMIDFVGHMGILMCAMDQNQRCEQTIPLQQQYPSCRKVVQNGCGVFMCR